MFLSPNVKNIVTVRTATISAVIYCPECEEVFNN
jgi:hypothetical protein